MREENITVDTIESGYRDMCMFLSIIEEFLGKWTKKVGIILAYCLLIILSLSRIWVFTIHKEDSCKVIRRSTVKISTNGKEECTYVFQKKNGECVYGTYAIDEFGGSWLKVGDTVVLYSYIDPKTKEHIYGSKVHSAYGFFVSIALTTILLINLLGYEFEKFHNCENGKIVTVSIAIIISVLVLNLICCVYPIFTGGF